MINTQNLKGVVEMPVLCDFVQIKGDGTIRIGDPPGVAVWEATFNTGGRNRSHPALLIFNVKGLTHTKDNVAVRVNDKSVGKIYRYGGGGDTAGYWFTQMIEVSGSTLNDGDNEIEIRAVGHPGSSAGNLYDDFWLKNVYCFFHQSA